MTAPPHLVTALADRYVIERELGRGGMATVYLARDLKHERHVALKLLDPDLGAVLGADRFLSEIRVTANLQHPNLLPLFDSGTVDGLLYYVMPYIEGETLRHRLDRERQLPVDEAVRIAVAIAGALDYAHQHGVIHRDLKPENILLQHGQPVVADFGIALAVSKAGGQRVTQTGLSLGTPQYMSPEQATGDRVIDARSDIYSLGALTYEMLAGEPPHSGTTAQAIIARLMTETPRSLTAVRPTVPPYVDDAIHCSLEKLPADRFASAHEFADALSGRATATTTRYSARNATRNKPSRSMMGALALAAGAALVLGLLLWRAESEPGEPPTRFVVDLPSDQRVRLGNGSSVTLSPDGRTVAYVAVNTDGSGNGVHVRRLDSLVAHPLPGGESGITPIFTADGKSIVLRSAGDLRRIPLGGGSPEILTALLDWQGFGMGPHGDVLLSQGRSIWKVQDDGKRTLITKPDSARGETSHTGPWFLDDKTFAFTIFKLKRGVSVTSIGVASLDGGPHKDLELAGDSPLGLVDGFLLFSNQTGSLLAAPVDIGNRRVTGPARVLLDSVVWIPAGGIQLNLARNGTIAYIKGSATGRMMLLDATGALIAEAPRAYDFAQPAFSPDGRRVVARSAGPVTSGQSRVAGDLWLWDTGTKGFTRLTFEGGYSPTWLPDGNRIVFLRSITGSSTGMEVWSVAADGSESPTIVARFPGRMMSAIKMTPSGRIALFTVLGDTTTASDIYEADITAAEPKLVPVVQTRFREVSPSVSPDGRWLAYVTDETGRSEAYVRAFHGTGARVKVSLDGGTTPQWATGGRRLIYTQGRNKIAATLDLAGSSPVVTKRDSLTFEGSRADVDPHTDNILVTRQPDDLRIVIVMNLLAQARAKLHGR